MLKRTLQTQILDAAKQFQVIAILGPRQSGKTTLTRNTFPHHAYVNLEDLTFRERATKDPKRFLQEAPTTAGIILDEVQHVPELFSYVQVLADENKQNGFYIFTGSQNFTLDAGISQSLAGRIAQFTLFPLSIAELKQAHKLPKTIEDLAFQGCYPKLYAQDIPVARLYSNYIQTYIEQDVRQIKNITDLLVFKKFMRMCAARTGQLLNLTSISDDLGIAPNTIKSWISLLVSSYIIFLIEPYYENYGRRLIKTPKLYFVDTGLACALLELEDAEDLSYSYLRGALVETCIMSDLYKQFLNADRQPSLYFWRDQTGHEIDAIIDKKPHPIALEIKASRTISSSYFDSMLFWSKITNITNSSNFVIYGGTDTQTWPHASVVSWQDCENIIPTTLSKRLKK